MSPLRLIHLRQQNKGLNLVSPSNPNCGWCIILCCILYFILQVKKTSFSSLNGQWMLLKSKESSDKEWSPACDMANHQTIIYIYITCSCLEKFLFYICDSNSTSSLPWDINLICNFNYSLGNCTFPAIKKKSLSFFAQNGLKCFLCSVRLSGHQQQPFIFGNSVSILLCGECSINVDWASKFN